MKHAFAILCWLLLCFQLQAQQPLWLLYNNAAERDPSVAPEEDQRGLSWSLGGAERMARQIDGHIRNIEAHGRQVDGLIVMRYWGFGSGARYPFTGRSELIEAAKLNPELLPTANDDDFASWFAWLRARHDLRMIIYIGTPVDIPIAEGEPLEDWVDKCLVELGPILRIRDVGICFDHTTDFPASEGRLGGPSGGLALLVKTLQDRGHTIYLESCLLAEGWANGLEVGVYCTEEQKPNNDSGRPFSGHDDWGPRLPPLQSNGPVIIQMRSQPRYPDRSATVIWINQELGIE